MVHVGCVWGRHTLRFYQSGGTWSGITNHQVTVLGADIPSWFVMHISLFNLFGTFTCGVMKSIHMIVKMSFLFCVNMLVSTSWILYTYFFWHEDDCVPAWVCRGYLVGALWVGCCPAWWLWYDLSSGCSWTKLLFYQTICAKRTDYRWIHLYREWLLSMISPCDLGRKMSQCCCIWLFEWWEGVVWLVVFSQYGHMLLRTIIIHWCGGYFQAHE